MHGLRTLSNPLENIVPGLSIDPSMKGAGFCGRHAATSIIRKITTAPKAIPIIAALEIETAIIQ